MKWDSTEAVRELKGEHVFCTHVTENMQGWKRTDQTYGVYMFS